MDQKASFGKVKKMAKQLSLISKKKAQLNPQTKAEAVQTLFAMAQQIKNRAVVMRMISDKWFGPETRIANCPGRAYDYMKEMQDYLRHHK